MTDVTQATWMHPTQRDMEQFAKRFPYAFRESGVQHVHELFHPSSHGAGSFRNKQFWLSRRVPLGIIAKGFPNNGRFALASYEKGNSSLLDIERVSCLSSVFCDRLNLIAGVFMDITCQWPKSIPNYERCSEYTNISVEWKCSFTLGITKPLFTSKGSSRQSSFPNTFVLLSFLVLDLLPRAFSIDHGAFRFKRARLSAALQILWLLLDDIQLDTMRSKEWNPELEWIQT
jgi:hypothetical protein